jgi:CRISPR-associated protein Csx17
VNEHRLLGCRLEPLGSYLKALGVLRLVGKQNDPDATGHWEGQTFVLRTLLDRDALLDFFLNDYRPTPLVAPWNGGSGFGPKDRQVGIAALEASTCKRTREYREAIAAARALVADPDWGNLEKEEQVERCRSTLPDAALEWVDATVVLGASSRAFPPLLGTGGNVGRLEFSNNFMQRLVQVVLVDASDSEAMRQSEQWLDRSLFEAGAPTLVRAAIGQFDPGAAGGANSSPLGDAGSLVNPWDYVLLLEGSLLFASGLARRLGAQGSGRASIPFTVDASPVGFATSASDESGRGELWAPVWDRPVAMSELDHLIGEGRAEWRGRQVRSGLDFARAVSSLAVDRGITAFSRHTFVERHGQNMLALSAGRIAVGARQEVPLLSAIDPWLDNVRRARNPPNAVAVRLRAVDAAMYDVAVHGGAEPLQRVLTALADLERAVSRSGNLRRERVTSPINGLSAARWLPALDDGSPEFRLAAALSSQRDPVPGGAVDRDRARSTAVMHYLRPVQPSERRRLEWADGGTRAPGLGTRALVDVLGEVLRLRAVDMLSRGSNELAVDEDSGQRGVTVAFPYRTPVPMEDAVAFLEGRIDEVRLEELLAACLLLDWDEPVDLTWSRQAAPAFDWSAPPAWQLLAPFFQPMRPADDEAPLRPGFRWVPLLLAGRVAEVVEEAVRRLRVARRVPNAGLTPSARAAMAATVRADRLAAALLLPISHFARRALFDRVSVRVLDDANLDPSPTSS